MDNLFIIKLITSFVVGGSIIAIISFFAEKTNENISGIILNFPATLALGLFFLAWTTSSEVVSNIIPAIFIPLGLSVFFIIVYLYIALYISNIVDNKIWQILLSTTISIGFWLVFSIPLALIKINNIFIGIVVYLLLTLLSHYILKRNSNYNKKILVHTYNFYQIIVRAIFSGFIVFLVVLFGEILNPFWSGIFSIFPITLLSSAIILHWYYNPEILFSIMRKTAIGSLSIFFYMIAVMISYPIFGFVIGTIISYLVSLTVILLLINLQKNALN